MGSNESIDSIPFVQRTPVENLICYAGCLTRLEETIKKYGTSCQVFYGSIEKMEELLFFTTTIILFKQFQKTAAKVRLQLIKLKKGELSYQEFSAQELIYEILMVAYGLVPNNNTIYQNKVLDD